MWLMACTAPTPYLSGLRDHSTLEGQAISVAFTVHHGTVEGLTSSDEDLVPLAAMELTELRRHGVAVDYRLHIAPAPSGTGQVTVGLLVDGDQGVLRFPFILRIRSTPSLGLSEIADQQGVVDQALVVSFTAEDDTYALEEVSASSDAASVVAADDLVVGLGGLEGHSHRLTITPRAAGSATITVTARNDVGGEASRSFLLQVDEPDGETITWTGDAGDGAWTTAGNWDLGRLPTSIDAVVIPAGSGTITVRDDDPFGSVDVVVRRLEHLGGTLRLRGPENCATCQRMVVRQSLRSSGADSRIELIRADLVVGQDSEIHVLAGTWEDGDPPSQGAGGGSLRSLQDLPEQGGGPLPQVVIATLEGHLIFGSLAVTLTEGGQIIAGSGFGQFSDGASLSIASGATVEFHAPDGFASPGFGGPDTATLIVAGRLHSSDANEWTLDIPVVVEAGGEVEIPSLAVMNELESHGRLQAASSLRLLGGAQRAPVTLHPGSVTASDHLYQQTPTTVSGQLLVSGTMDAAMRSASLEGPITFSDAATLSIDRLDLGPSRAVIHLPTAQAEPPIRLLTGNLIDLHLAGPQPLRVEAFEPTAGRLSGMGGQATLQTGSLRFVGPLNLLSDVTVELSGIGRLDPGQVHGRGGATLRVLEGAELRFNSVTLRPDPDDDEGALAFDHLGAVQAWGGASTLEACIGTGPAAQTLPPNSASATLTVVDSCGTP